MSIRIFQSVALSFVAAAWLIAGSVEQGFAQRTVVRGEVRAGYPGGVVQGDSGPTGRVGESKVGNVPAGGGRGTGGGAGLGGGAGAMMGGRVGAGFHSSAQRGDSATGGGLRGLYRAADRYNRDWSVERPAGNLTYNAEPPYDEVIGDRVYLRGDDRRSLARRGEYADDLGLGDPGEAAVRIERERVIDRPLALENPDIDRARDLFPTNRGDVIAVDDRLDDTARRYDDFDRYNTGRRAAVRDYGADRLDNYPARTRSYGGASERDRFDDRRVTAREEVGYRDRGRQSYEERDRTSRSYRDRDRRTSDAYDARRDDRYDDRYEGERRDDRARSSGRDSDREWFDDREERTARQDSGRRYSGRDDRTRTQDSTDNRTPRRTSRTADRVDRGADRSPERSSERREWFDER